MSLRIQPNYNKVVALDLLSKLLYYYYLNVKNMERLKVYLLQNCIFEYFLTFYVIFHKKITIKCYKKINTMKKKGEHC